MKTRRDALKALAVVSAAAPVLDGQHEHAGGAMPTAQPAKPVVFKAMVFNTAQIALIGLLADHIIPKSDTPGAADAGVPLIVDSVAANNAAFKKRWLVALAFFDKAKFRQMTAEEQVAFLTNIQDSEHFRLVKDSTIDAYYSTKEGLATELGWHGNTFLAEFKGCTHPEHHASQE
jgi:hypothetical protein